MVNAGRVHALAEGRAHVSFADIQYFSEEVLGHRVLLNYDGQAENINVLDMVQKIVKHVPEEV